MSLMQESATEGQVVANRFLSALAQRDFATVASCFSEDARFRGLLPSRSCEAEGAEAAMLFQQWFGLADRLDVLDRHSCAIADRQHLSWRFRLHDELGRRVIEQQAFATIDDGRFVQFDLVCSGFRPEDSPETEAVNEIDGGDITVAETLEGGDANCATLTPLIKSRLSDLASGEVLEVVTSEPTAERDIVSWCNLTGHTLVGVRPDGSMKRFFVRKK